MHILISCCNNKEMLSGGSGIFFFKYKIKTWILFFLWGFYAAGSAFTASALINNNIKDIYGLVTASSVVEVQLLVMCYSGCRRFTCSRFRGDHLPGDSGGLGHHGERSLLRGSDLAFFRRFLGAEVEPRGVEAEWPWDVDLARHLPPPLGLRRALWSYLEETWWGRRKGGGKQRMENKKRTGKEVKKQRGKWSLVALYSRDKTEDNILVIYTGSQM